VAAAAPVAPAPVKDTPVRAFAPRSAEGEPTRRYDRPGSLLDIRV
jgi:hypothetical protein